MAAKKIKKGDKVMNSKDQEVIVTRTSTDEDGFLVVYFELDGQEQSCFAVDCYKLS